jgi:hypothetical protein
MTWPSEFRELLYSGGIVHQALLLECIMPANGEGVGLAEWFASTDPSLAPYARLLQKSGFEPRLGSTGVNIQSWSPIEGGWSVTVKVADGLVAGQSFTRPALEYASKALRKGAMLRLSIGEVGYAKSEYQPLKIGRINQVQNDGHPNLFRIDVWDLTTAIRTRMSTAGASTAERAKLFYNSAGQLDTLSSNYSTGDTSLAITGATTNRFLRETGQRGAVIVDPHSGGHPQFYLTFTGETTNTLTGLSATGQFGTTEHNATSGDTVKSVVLLEGHPIDILRKVLVSTGAGTNGAFDTLPQAWSLGIPEDMLSDTAWDRAKRILKVTGAYEWRFLLTAEIDDPASWIVQTWGTAGIWLAFKEGQIVPRFARQLHTAGLSRQFGDITDSEIIEVPKVIWHPPDVPEVYQRIQVTYNGGTVAATSNVTTLPARKEIEYDISAVNNTVTSQVAIANETRDRLAGWAHFVPEFVEVVLYGLRSYAAGDVIQLSTTGVRGRLTGTRYGYENRLVMVVREEMDIGENKTMLTLATLPTDRTEDE